MRFFSFSLLLILSLSFLTFAQKKQSKYQAEVSNPAPDFTATALSGKTYKLSDLKGKTVVLNFWSTSCFACQDETEALNKLATDFKNKNVVFLGFANEAEPKLQKFLKKYPFQYEIIPASMQQMIVPYGRPIGNGFFDLPFPMHVVINKDGIIEVNELGVEGISAVRKKLEQLTR